jgi:hypothetical protein
MLRRLLPRYASSVGTTFGDFHLFKAKLPIDELTLQRTHKNTVEHTDHAYKNQVLHKRVISIGMTTSRNSLLLKLEVPGL